MGRTLVAYLSDAGAVAGGRYHWGISHCYTKKEDHTKTAPKEDARLCCVSRLLSGGCPQIRFPVVRGARAGLEVEVVEVEVVEVVEIVQVVEVVEVIEVSSTK